MGTPESLWKEPSNNNLEILVCGGEQGLGSHPCGHARTWHSQWEASALVQKYHPFSRERVISTDIAGFPIKGAMRKCWGTWGLEGNGRGRVIPMSESSGKKKQTLKKRLVPTFVETPKKDTVAPLCCHLLSLANIPGTVLSALYTHFHAWSY